MPPTSRRRNKNIDIERLEERHLLTAFGTPWPDARDLTISFPADGVTVGSQSNDIRQTLDQVADRQQWEELALRAYQTWAIHADINIGLRNDHGLDFGSPGLNTADPRFGEFRIGAMPQTGLLASSLPFQAHAGTYSGDILLNSNEQFVYHDWENQVGPDPASIGEFDVDLFSLLLHEAGNTLGLPDNQFDWSVMFRQYTVPKGVLTQDDIDAIQQVYGQRSDPYEDSDNGDVQLATLIPTPVGFDPDNEVISTRGSLVDGSDVDYYRIDPIAGQGKVWVRLRAEGISLLQSQLEVLDEHGQVIKQASAASVFENDNTVKINGLGQHSVLYLRVSALDSNDVYAVGDYELEIDYRNENVQQQDPVRSSYDAGADRLFANFALIDDEQGDNDTIPSAQSLTPVTFLSHTHYELKSSVSSSSDVDVLEITAPDVVDGRLVISVAGVGLDQPELDVEVVDSDGNAVGTAGRIRADGTLRLEVAQPEADMDYYLQISVDPASPVSVGNYVVTAEFTAPPSDMNDMISGTLSSNVDTFIRWTASMSKLYRFDLAAWDGDPDELVRLTIYDAHNQQVSLIVLTPSGVTRTGYAWLAEGDYILRFAADSRNGDAVDHIQFSLAVDGISDDQEWTDDGESEGEHQYQYYYVAQGPGGDDEGYIYEYSYPEEEARGEETEEYVYGYDP